MSNIPETDYEDLTPAPAFTMTPAQVGRFWRKTVVDAKGCRVWCGATKGGYGYVVVSGVGYRANRLSLMMELGRPLTPGLRALHRSTVCHNPMCVNPEHLYEGTPAQNNADMVADGTACRGTRHGMAKLNEAQVWEIRDSTDHPSVLAARYGITTTNVRSIRANRTWRHIIRPSNDSYGI
jgi:hypothetical protein